MDKDINIAIALNDKVIIPAYVMVRSIAVNHVSQSFCIYVLYSELEEDYRQMLIQAANYGNADHNVEFIEVDACKTQGLPFNQFWSVETYYRLMLPEILGDKIERILYLDIDIVVNKNILDFYNTDFEDKLFIVTKDVECENILALDDSQARKRNAYFRELRNDGMVYFCAGVLLMNLKKLKERYTFDKYMEIFESLRDRIELLDQDLLNFTHYKEVKFVDETKYGLFTQTAHENGMTYEEAKNNVSILHFTGKAKPWTINLIRYDIEKIWWEYAKDSPFYQELLERVFYQSMESHFAEDKLQELMKENQELKEMLGKCQALIQKLSSGI